MTVTELRQQYETKNKALQEILAKGAEASVEEIKSADALDKELATMTDEIKAANRMEEMKSRATGYNTFLNAPATTVPAPGGDPSGSGGSGASTDTTASDEVKNFVVPATVWRGGMKSFVPEMGFTGYTRAQLEYKAYRFGMWMVGILQASKGLHNTKQQAWCKAHGVPHIWQAEETKAQVEGINTDGGFLVPEEIATDIIVLREQFGVGRRVMRSIPMASDTKRVPRQTGNMTTYWVDENAMITESKFTTDSVLLVAKKLGALGSWSSEVGEDSFIDMGDKLAMEVAYAFSSTEDDCIFNGDGSSTYAGMVGFRKALINLGTIANTAGLVTQTGTGAFTSTLSDFQNVIGVLPEYADTPNVRWVCHRYFWSSVMSKVELAAGGVTSTEVINGVRQRTFLGYPVEISQKMPKVYVANDVPCLFGDFGLAGKFGDRRQMTLAMSEHVNFKQDQLVIRGTERFDVNVHDVGNNDSTAANRVAGPVVGLATGTS